MASLRNYFAEEKRKHDEALAEKPQWIEDDADYERINEINDEWNRNVAKIRNERLKQQRIQMREKIEWELEQQHQYEEEERRRINELVLKEKVCVKFIKAGYLGNDIHETNKLLYSFIQFVYLGSSKIVYCARKFRSSTRIGAGHKVRFQLCH